LLLIDNKTYHYALDEELQSSLFWACHGGNVAIVNFLISKGCDIHMADKEGRTPLMEACSYGYLSIAEVLIDKGARINQVNNTGKAILPCVYWK
jgi:ankyrin repeat protein